MLLALPGVSETILLVPAPARSLAGGGRCGCHGVTPPPGWLRVHFGSWGKRFQSPPASKPRLGFPWDREAAGDARRERSAAEVYLRGERPPHVSPLSPVPFRVARLSRLYRKHPERSRGLATGMEHGWRTRAGPETSARSDGCSGRLQAQGDSDGGRRPPSLGEWMCGGLKIRVRAAVGFPPGPESSPLTGAGTAQAAPVVTGRGRMGAGLDEVPPTCRVEGRF